MFLTSIDNHMTTIFQSGLDGTNFKALVDFGLTWQGILDSEL